MTEAMLLKFVVKEHPYIDVDRYRKLLSASEVDERIVREIYDQTVGCSITGKKNRDEIIFVASILKLYSPQSLFIGDKTKNSVCDLIYRVLDLSYNQKASYRIKVAKELFEVDKVFRFQVDQIVRRYRDGE
ncbi:hypothetical protein QT327_10465 [Olivibacter sp. 47]|uniref:hypothetical protein n=1 Tax=Olivibacter sp. 47 TaxID=3056486 RepID=UPI0025A3437E|nr:hypothetical protein [Olivibacter sp. 47]MDM8174774.1 hypothetical protein [Olivibacter sp. 47]